MASDDVKEIEPEETKIPEGSPGNLTDEQHAALVKMWESYFDICDRAKGEKTKGDGFKEDKSGKDPKKSGIPQDDAAKDEAKKQEEQQGMNDLLETYGSEALRDAFWNFVRFDDPDGMMMRFVRARKQDVGRAMAMMATTLRWRLDTDVEALVEKGDLVNGKEISKFVDQQKSGKVFALGCSSETQPICYVIMKYHSVWGQPAASMQKFIVTQMETFRYVSNAPYIFWGFWKGVSPLLDPVVRNKICFISNPSDCGGHVEPDTVIKYCGGTNEAVFEYVDAEEGENDCQKDTKTKERLKQRHRKLTDQFEKVTRNWCESGGKDDELIEKRAVLVKKLRLSQLDMDLYFRGLTVYHRDGTVPIGNPGMANFDYVHGNETVRQVMGKPTCRKSLERELCDIVDGSSCKEAEEMTKKTIADGSWGQWRVNDNSPEIVKKAMASLEDPEGSNKVDIEKGEPGAVAAQEQIQSNANGDASDNQDASDQEDTSNKAPNGSAAAATPAPKKKMTSSPSKKRMSKSNAGTTDYGKEDTGPKTGLLSSIKSKIGVN